MGSEIVLLVPVFGPLGVVEEVFEHKDSGAIGLIVHSGLELTLEAADLELEAECD